MGLFFTLAFVAGGRAPGELLRPSHGEKLSQEELKQLFLSSGAASSPSPSHRSTPSPETSTSKRPLPSEISKKANPAPPSPPPQHSIKVERPAVAPADSRPLSKPPTVIVLKESLSEPEESDEGEELPTTSQKKSGFWPFSWGRKDPGAKRWRYLTPALRRELDAIKLRRGRWRYVIVHNSGSRNGNARIFDYYHRRVKKMRNGMAYHFVIGNGSASRMGQIEIGDRWRRQINGGHVASDHMNNIGIGVCLVGDFNKYPPPQQQLDALRELVEYLRERAGGRSRGRLVVKGHKEVNPPHRSTDCPGDKFSLRELHRMFD